MRNWPVNWSEGMFLRPHHFQASDRYWAEFVGMQSLFDHPYGYGVQGGTISTEGLSNGVLEIRGLRVRWKDGTLLRQPDNCVNRIDIAKHLDVKSLGTKPLTVHVALAIANEGQENVSSSGASPKHRFVKKSIETEDDGIGKNPREVSLRELNLQFLFTVDDLSALKGYESVPVVRLVKDTIDDSQFRIDAEYYPPCLSIQSWPDLAEIMRRIYDLLCSRNQVLVSIIKEKRVTLSSQLSGDLEKMLLLHALNEGIGELRCLAFASGIHPLVAYTSLCRIVGQCSIFGDKLVVDGVPEYDHDDLATIFRWALERIRTLILSVKEDEFEQRYFVGAGRGMHVNLEPEWFGPEWDWYFGVDPTNIGREECFRLMKGPDTQGLGIDWKLGSADKVEQYMTNRQPGISMRLVQQPPRVLPSRGNWVYYAIKREGDPWNQVQVSQSMAMRVKTEQISNIDSLDGARRLRLSIGGRAFGLEFAIFAVRKRI